MIYSSTPSALPISLNGQVRRLPVESERQPGLQATNFSALTNMLPSRARPAELGMRIAGGGGDDWPNFNEVGGVRRLITQTFNLSLAPGEVFEKPIEDGAVAIQCSNNPVHVEIERFSGENSGAFAFKGTLDGSMTVNIELSNLLIRNDSEDTKIVYLEIISSTEPTLTEQQEQLVAITRDSDRSVSS